MNKENIVEFKDCDLPTLLRKYFSGNEKSLLDIGCDTGRDCFPFIELGFDNISGIDINLRLKPRMFSYFLINRKQERRLPEHEEKQDHKLKYIFDEEKLRELFYDSSLEFDDKFEFIIDEEKGNFINYSKAEEQFDVILASKIFHFFEPDLALKLIDKVSSLLKPGGLFYFAYNNLDKMKLKNPSAIIEVENKVRFLYSEQEQENRIWYEFNETRLDEIKVNFSKIEFQESVPGALFEEIIFRK